MSFVDELRKTEAPKKSEEQRVFEKAVQDMRSAVRAFCINRKQARSATGYLMYSQEREYCNESYDMAESLTRPYERELTDYELQWVWRYKKDETKPANFQFQGWDETRPVAKDTSACKRYGAALYELLKEDGFTNISLEVVPEYNVVDKLKSKGILGKTYWWERVTTDQIIGYTLKVSVSW